MKYTLVGCGRVAPSHIKAALQNHLEIAGLCDLQGQKAEALKQQFSLDSSIPVYTDYEKMFDEIKPEFTAIATYSGEHARIALAALSRGIHVDVEKPIALSLDDADQMIRTARENHVVLGVNHQNRFNPSIRMVRKALENGSLGEIAYAAAHVRWHRGEDYYAQDTSWRGTYAQDGGTLMNQCIHNADLLRWMLGDEIEEVCGMTANRLHPYIEAEDTGMAMIRFRNGALGIFEGTTNAWKDDLEETLYVFGSKGTVKVGGVCLNHIDVWNVEGQEDSLDEIRRQCDEDPVNVYGNGHTPLYQDVIHAIETGGRPLVDGEAGRRALELILGIYESQRVHNAVEFPLHGLRCIDYKPQ